MLSKTVLLATATLFAVIHGIRKGPCLLVPRRQALGLWRRGGEASSQAACFALVNPEAPAVNWDNRAKKCTQLGAVRNVNVKINTNAAMMASPQARIYKDRLVLTHPKYEPKGTGNQHPKTATVAAFSECEKMCADDAKCRAVSAAKSKGKRHCTFWYDFNGGKPNAHVDTSFVSAPATL